MPLQMKENHRPNNSSASPFDYHKRSRSSYGVQKSDPIATLQKQLHELAQQNKSYSIKEKFVKTFMERL